MVIFIRVQGRRSASGRSTTTDPPDRGLKFEPDAEIGEKAPFRSLRLSAKVSKRISKKTAINF